MKVRPYLVFYATRVALVTAANKAGAYDAFMAEMFPPLDRHTGRFMPPVRSEVNIRRLRADDRGWIEEFQGRAANAFVKALETVR